MDNYTFYIKYFPDLKSTPPRQNVKCIFHEDKNPSFSINLEDGLWYCHSCKKGGDIFSFYMEHHGVPFKRAKQEILGSRETPALSIANVEEAHRRLLKSESIRNVLYAKKLWTKETIEKFRLGWEEERVCIPILDTDNKLLNIRKYDILHKSKDKFRGIPGHNEVTLFPQKNLERNPIIMFAGEPDAITADQFGLPSITFTSGEGAVNKKLLPAFKGKLVYICYDIDDPGKRAASIVANQLCSIASQVRIIHLPEEPLQQINGNDFSDLAMGCSQSKIDFTKVWNEIVSASEIFTVQEQAPLAYNDYIETDFYKAIDAVYFNKNIHFKALAIGSSMAPFLCPKKILINCDMGKGDNCKSCGLFFSGGEFTYEVPEKSQPELINLSTEDQKKKLKSIVAIGKCNAFRLTISEVQPIENVWITPTLESERIEQKFVSRKSYVTGYGTVTNKIYDFYGKTFPDPEDQVAVHWFTKLNPVVADLYNFKLKEEYIDALKIFRPEEDDLDAIGLKFLEIIDDINYNGPGVAIISREDLFIALDLVYHTVLSFNFLNDLVHKGWGECLILGDTGTGKTAIATKLMQHYKLGEYITLEKSTVSGIIGGVSKIGNSNVFTWGIFPINDGRMVILDEANGLDTDAISNLSALRSTGVAERTIVGSTRRTQARVRAAWISNPRSNVRSISHYSSGVEAIKELIGRPEDIQRFDFAIIVSSDQVPLDLINTISKKYVSHRFTSELCNNLLMWTWNRQPEHIKFEKGTESLILKTATQMGEKYSSNIPIVLGATQRIKLARLAIAVACRLFSTDDKAEKVIVKPCHVDFVRTYLDKIYNEPNFNYEDWSVREKTRNDIPNGEHIRSLINALMEPITFVSKILDTNKISISDLEDFTKANKDNLKYFRSELVNNNCLVRRENFYLKTPGFTLFLKYLLKNLKEKTKVEKEKKQ